MGAELSINYNFWQGGKVQLRQMLPNDWQRIFEEESDSESLRLFNAGIAPRSAPDGIMERVEQNMKNRHAFAVENGEGDFVGVARIDLGDRKDGTFSFCIRIFRTYQRSGYAYDAIKIILRYGFFEMRCHKANSETIDSNDASVHLHRALGFVEEGRRRQNVYTDGQYHDEILFGMTEEEYRNLVTKNVL